jgi:hypothetical protein
MIDALLEEYIVEDRQALGDLDMIAFLLHEMCGSREALTM